MNIQRAIPCVFFAIVFASPARADDAARVSRLESEIQQLRTQIDEQNRRILRLESELARRSGTAETRQPPREVTSVKRQSPSSAAGPQAWHVPAPWSRVAKGMNTGEVIGILGEPSAVESVDGFKTLFYRGTTSAGASISGIVNLRDERVVAVVKPTF